MIDFDRNRLISVLYKRFIENDRNLNEDFGEGGQIDDADGLLRGAVLSAHVVQPVRLTEGQQRRVLVLLHNVLPWPRLGSFKGKK